MNSTINFFEIPLSNFDRGVKFYSEIFNIKLKATKVNGLQMAFFPTKKKGIGGALVHGKGYKPSPNGAIPYLSFEEDINNILSKVRDAGGEVVVPPKTALYEAEGNFGMFIDSEGNRVGIFRKMY